MVFPYVVQCMIFELCLVEDLYKFMIIPICQQCALRRYRYYNSCAHTKSMNYEQMWSSQGVDFIKKCKFDAVACSLVLYGESAIDWRYSLTYDPYELLPTYIRHRKLLFGNFHVTNVTYFRSEIDKNTLMRVIMSPLLTRKVACDIGYSLILAQSPLINFFLRYRSKILFPDNETAHRSFWGLFGHKTDNADLIVEVLKVYNPPLRYLRVILCHLLKNKVDAGIDFIVNRFTPLTYPIFFRTDDPLKATLLHHPKYVHTLLNLNLFYAYRDYTLIGQEYISDIIQAQQRIRVGSVSVNVS